MKIEKVTTLTIVLALAMLVFNFAYAEPTGVDIAFNSTEMPGVTPASSLTTAGGSFTTLVLNGTYQNPRWKAYVGNVSGVLTLSDSAGSSIYNWGLAAVSGQVYVSRNDTVDWSTAGCAPLQAIEDEEAFLNKDSSSVDSIVNTFNHTIHRSFFIGTTEISSNTCRSLVTNVNDASQTPSETANFQEVLISDGVGNVVYTTLLEDSVVGFDGSLFDFQMIVPEMVGSPTPTTYYFYAEIN